ncbi:MAG: hypothetical protein VX246_04595 [Myxococcota bacterium]|nr:hypothetical protein [Myxococcota bacterium]
MRVRPVANALVLSIVLGCGALGCGKYGPPVRVYDIDMPVTPELSDADEADDESEPRPDQP